MQVDGARAGPDGGRRVGRELGWRLRHRVMLGAGRPAVQARLDQHGDSTSLRT
jgi:hypothetical protein